MAQINAQNQLLPLQTENQRIQNQLEIKMLNQMNTNAAPGGSTTGSPYFVPGKGVGFINPEQAATIQEKNAITQSVNQKTQIGKQAVDEVTNVQDMGKAADEARRLQQQQRTIQPKVQDTPPTTQLQNTDPSQGGVNSTMVNPYPYNLPLLQQPIQSGDSQDQSQYS